MPQPIIFLWLFLLGNAFHYLAGFWWFDSKCPFYTVVSLNYVRLANISFYSSLSSIQFVFVAPHKAVVASQDTDKNCSTMRLMDGNERDKQLYSPNAWLSTGKQQMDTCPQASPVLLLSRSQTFAANSNHTHIYHENTKYLICCNYLERFSNH